MGGTSGGGPETGRELTNLRGLQKTQHNYAEGHLPLPRMDECIDSLGDEAVYSALDANWGY